MMMLRKITTAILATLAIGWHVQPLISADTLTIGSDAPPLDVEHWIVPKDGSLKPIKEFSPGKVYVVEFWATWSGPSVASLTHLIELQKQFTEKGVQIVSISKEDLTTVEDFLEKPVPLSVDKATYGDIAEDYCLAADADGSSHVDYMNAAEQSEIPISFVVGKTGKIEWIGHPIELNDVLDQVVNDRWDRDVRAAEFQAKQQAEKSRLEAADLMRNEKYAEALPLLEEAIKIAESLNKNDDIQLQLYRIQAQLGLGKSEDAIAQVAVQYKKLEDDPTLVNMFAWNLFEMASRLEALKPELIAESITATEKAIKRAEQSAKGSLLDTLAHYYFANGKLNKAIEVEKEASKLATEQDKEFIANYLDFLMEEEKKAREAAKQETGVEQ